jgi:NADPH:quinone reductase-like Zn-dependent oxidoreductase
MTTRRVVLHQLAASLDEPALRRALRVEMCALAPLEPGLVRVRMAFAALNFADVLVCQGKYQERPPLPLGVGSEGSGVVVESRDDSGALPAGTRVIVMATGGGTFREVMDVHPLQVFPVGPAFPLDIAAGFAVAAGTAHVGLVDRGGAAAGDTVVVTGASGGTGMYAVLIAAALGCRVVATARGEAKTTFVRSLLAGCAGGGEAVDLLASSSSSSSSSSTSAAAAAPGEGSEGGEGGAAAGGRALVAAVERVSGGVGAKVVYDTVGGELFPALLKCAKWKCNIVVVRRLLPWRAVVIIASCSVFTAVWSVAGR